MQVPHAAYAQFAESCKNVLAHRVQCQANIIFFLSCCWLSTIRLKARRRCASHTVCLFMCGCMGCVCVCVYGICNIVCVARFRLKIMLCLPTVSTKSSSDSATKQKSTFWPTMTTNKTKSCQKKNKTKLCWCVCDCVCVSYLAMEICVS